MGLFKEFKEFAVKGNAIDMAVGIIIGGAFNKLITSLVNDIIMPPIGYLLGGTDFKNLQIVLKPESVDALGQKVPAAVLRYGLFINNIVDFLIISFTIFIVVKVMNKMLKARQTAPAAPAK